MTALDACWNRIGLRGDHSCPKLVEHIHCRNCPTYEAAAASLLDRPLPEGYREEAAAHYRLETAEAVLGTHSAFVFRIGDEWLCLPSEYIVEVVEMRPIHSLPLRRDGIVAGLANVRGELLVCVSLADVLGIELARGAGERPRLIVVRHGEHRQVFPADAVHGVERYHPDALGPVPATLAGATAHYAHAMLPWGDRAVGCLDPERLFHDIDRSLA